jgi:hypothetical protein
MRRRAAAAFREAKEDAMVHLQLTIDEAATLKMALEDFLSDLRMEIAHTDSMDFREGLKTKKRILRKVADALTTPEEEVR